jgi:hypothetical protein
MPASVKQVAAAMAALGAYTGNNTSAEHAAEAARLGGADAYRVRLVNALLGVVQAQAVLADAVPLDEQARDAAWEEHLRSARAGPDEVAARLELIRWQVLRSPPHCGRWPRIARSGRSRWRPRTPPKPCRSCWE